VLATAFSNPLRFDNHDAQHERLERRHSGRVESSGTAIVHCATALHGRILDVAVGGLNLLVDRAATTPEVGTFVRIDLRFDGNGRWLLLTGSVVRVDARGSASALVIKLLDVPPDFEDLVQDELVFALECTQQRHLLLVDAARGRRELVAAAFRATGCVAIEVSSPLEAIGAIDQSGLHLWGVVIADTELASRADELREFLSETYPQVPLIVVGEHERVHGSWINSTAGSNLALQIDDFVSPRHPGVRLARRSLDRLASAAAAQIGAPLVLISLVDGPRQIYVGSHGLSKARAGDPSPLCRNIAITGRPIVMQDARHRLPLLTRGPWEFELAAYAGVALPSRAGAFAVLTSARRAWQRHELNLLGCLAEAATAILDMQDRCDLRVGEERQGAANELEIASATEKRRTAELVNTSIHDELTGLFNRRGLFSVAAAQLDCVRRHSIGGLLVYVDLDGLKATNDRHGHAAGDELLRAAATVLRSSFRETDTIARLGGDEFVVLATDTPRADHPVILTRLAAELARANERRDPRIPLAWSLGLISIEPVVEHSLDDLMSAADRRMYSAKRALHDIATHHP
jgi:diguanylate cyclase (GGDEF)-like protein